MKGPNEQKAKALLDSVRDLTPSGIGAEVANRLGLQFFEDEPMTLEQVKIQHVVRVLNEQNWNQTKAAVVLGVNKVSLYRWIRDYELYPGKQPAILQRRRS